MLVEIRCVHERRRTVRYAIFSLHVVSLTGHLMWLTDTFYQHFVPNGTASNISERIFKKNLIFLTLHPTGLAMVPVLQSQGVALR